MFEWMSSLFGGGGAQSVLSDPGTTFSVDPNAFSSVPWANNSAAGDYGPSPWAGISQAAHGVGQIASAMGRQVGGPTAQNPGGGVNLQQPGRVPITGLSKAENQASNMADIEARLRAHFAAPGERVYRNFNQQERGNALGPIQRVPRSADLAAFKSGYKYGTPPAKG